MSKTQYKIAVLLPTHKRTDDLSRSVFSLIDRAGDLDSIEFLLGIDNNDDIALNHFSKVLQPEFDQRGVNYSVLSFEPMGYFGLNKYFDTLAAAADADWYFCFSDDAVMETQDWDLRIAECTGEFKLLKVHAHNEHPYSIFPIVPAAWRKVTGYLSQHQLIDAELSQLAYFLDLMKIIEVTVTHDRPDLTGRAADETAKKKQYLEGNPSDPRDFHHANFINQRNQDLIKLVAYMQKNNLDMTFFNQVQAGERDPWELMRQNDPNGQTCSFNVVTDATGKEIMVKA